MKSCVLCWIALPLLVVGSAAAHAAPPLVTVTDGPAAITLDNGIVAIDIGKAKSQITSIRYRRGGRVIELSKTMYSSASAAPTEPGSARPPAGSLQIAQRSAPRIVRGDGEAAEAAVDNGPTPTYPFRTETHYYVPRGESGFYVWQRYTHDAQMPAATLGEARFVIKGPPGPSLFTNHVVDAHRLGPYDTSPIVRKVSDATFLLQDGSIYTKYDNAAVLGDHFVHGMTGHGIGLWMINPSNEYINGGPVKQELTVHADNTLLNMLQGAHFGSGVLNFQRGEEWRKLYGPFLVYVNGGESAEAMYRNALQRVRREQARWPYRWVQDVDYPVERGAVQGTLHFTTGSVPRGAWVGLAAPGGDWPLQGKGYQYWSRVDGAGRFRLTGLRPGHYTLYAWGAGEFEQFARDGVEVSAGKNNDLGDLRWKPIRHGKTIWQIGVADRSTREFRDGDNVRHFANYLRYAGAFPRDVTFEVGKSREADDWNYAHWTWYCRKPYWTIAFDCPAASHGTATLTFGIAASCPARGGSNNVTITVNGHDVGSLHLSKSGAAVYRSGGMDSLYRVETMTFDAALLKTGSNEIRLAHADAQPIPPRDEQMLGHIGAVLYDAIRLEVDSAP
jgi:rhamnogalacturonan endolyase